MELTFANFSFGTTGSIPLPPSEKKPPAGSRGPLKVRHGSPQGSSNQSSCTKKDNGIFIEELKLPEIMLPNQNVTNYTETAQDIDGNAAHQPTDRIINTSRFEPKRQFIQGFQEAVTKKDQFAKMKSFETEILRVQDANEKYVLTGIKAVEKLENKLKEVCMYHVS